jgi:hypothetical protein
MANKKQTTNLERRLARVETSLKKDDARVCHVTPGEVQEFTMSCLDPDQYPATRYPDVYCEPTSVFTSRNKFNLPIITTACYGLEAGEFRAVVSPEKDGTISYVAEFPGRVRGHFQRGGLLLDEEGHLAKGSNAENTGRHIEAGIRYSLFATVENDSGTAVQYPTVHETPGGPIAAGLPALDAINLNLSFEYLDWNPSSSPAGTIYLNVIDSSTGAIVATGSSSILRNATTVTIPVAGTSLGMTEGIQSTIVEVQWVLTAGEGTLLFLGAYGSCRTSYFRWDHETIPDLAEMNAKFSKYRVTAQSALLTYLGSTLTQAGQVASHLYKGGYPHALSRLSDYSSIAEVAGAYNGPLRDGTYVYWEPTEERDMRFRTARSTYQRPTILIAGIFDDTLSAGAGVLRLQVATAFEFTTTSQLYPVRCSRVCPDLILARAALLRNVPNAMENGKHLEKLSRIAKGIYGGARRTTKWAIDHEAELKTLATLLAALF